MLLLMLVSAGVFAQNNTWYAITSGEWSNAEIWTLDPAASVKVNPKGEIPDENDIVVIKSGRTITMDADGYKANVLTVDGRLELKQTVGQQFSQIRGSGRIVMEADNFPSGDATHFTSKNQGEGTVVFKGSSNIDVFTSYEFFNLEVDHASRVRIRRDLVLNGNLVVKGGDFRFGPNEVSVTVYGNVFVETPGEMSVANNLDYHWFNVYGDFINNGSVDFSKNNQFDIPTKGVVKLKFLGETDNEFRCKGKTELHRLFVDKGTDKAFKLNVTADQNTNFQLYGPVTGTTSDAADGNAGWQRLPIVIENGTLELGSNVVIDRLGENIDGNAPNEFTIPETGHLILNGGSVNSSTSTGNWNGITLYGKLTVAAGELTTPAGTNGLNYATNGKTPQFEVTGGTVNLTQIRPYNSADKFSYAQSGGLVDFFDTPYDDNSSAVLHIGNNSAVQPANLNTDFVFNMSGGNLRFSHANSANGWVSGIRLEVNEGNYNVTGGNIEVADLSGSQKFDIFSTSPLYNLSISNTTPDVQITGWYGASYDASWSTDFEVLNNLTIGPGTTFNDLGHSISVGGSLDIAGTYTQSGGLVFNGLQNGEILNSTGTTLTLDGLTINKDRHPTDGSYYSVRLSGAGNINFDGDVTLTRGALDVVDYWPTVTGNVIISDGDLTSSGTGGLELTGSAPILIGKFGREFNFGDIRLNNGNNGLTLGTNVNVESFAFAGSGTGKVNLGVHNLTVTGSLSNANNSRFFYTNGEASDGGLTLPITAGSNGTNIQSFPIGSGTGRYTPMQVDANAAVSSNGTITVNPVNDYHPTVTDQTYALEYYWKVDQSGLENDVDKIRYQFTHYAIIDVDVYEQWFFGTVYYYPTLNTFENATWNDYDDGNGDSNGGTTLTFPYLALLENDFSYGVLEGGFWWGEWDAPRTLYSRDVDGAFNARNTWTEDADHDPNQNDRAGSAPTAIDFCVIGAGHTVYINSDNNNASQILIEEGGTLIVEDDGNNQIYTHNIDVIKGGGTLVYEEDNNYSTYLILNADHSEFCNDVEATIEFTGVGNNRILPSNSLLPYYPNLKISGSNLVQSDTDEDLIINGNLTVESGTLSLLTYQSEVVEVGGDVVIDSGTLTFNHTWSDNRYMDIGGDIEFTGTGTLNDNTSNGNIYLKGNINQKNGSINLTNSTLIFEGTESATYSNTGGLANFNRIEINKPLSQSVTFNGAFFLNGSSNGTTKALELTSGECYINNSGIEIDLTTGGNDFEIPSSSKLYVTDGIVYSSGNSGIKLDGSLIVDGGTANLDGTLASGGPSNSSYIEFTSSGNSYLEVSNYGILNVGDQIRRSTNADEGILSFVQKGATVNIGNTGGDIKPTRGMFEIMGAGSSFSQGEDDFITIYRSNQSNSVPSLYFNPENVSYTGSCGFAFDVSYADGEVFGVYAPKNLNDVTLTGGAASGVGSGNEVTLLTREHTLNGDLSIGANTTFDANGLDLNLYGNLTNSGTYKPSYNTTYFKGDASQTISGDVALHKVVKDGSAILLQAEDTEVTINDDLNILSGVVNTADNQLIVKGNLLIENGASTQSSSATDGVVMAGSNSQLLQVEGEIGRLSVNNTAGVVVPTQGGAINFSGQLKLDAGVLDIGRNLLVIGKDAEIVSGTAGFSEDAMIQTNLSFTDAGVQKFLPAITSLTAYTIPIGSMGKYTPVGLNVSTTGNATGSIRVKAANEPHITIPASEKNRVLHYNWTLDAEGIENFSANVTMQAFAEAVEGDGSAYITARLLDASEGYWNKYNLDGFDENNYVLNFTFSGTDDAGIDGDFTAGEEDAIPEKVQAFVTRSNGLWNDASTWSVEGSGVVPSGGPRGAIVKVNHKVTVPESIFSAVAYMTDLGNNGTLDFGSTFGHRLGKVKGTGRIILQRNALPAGMYDEFFSKNGGTLEFTGDTDYDVLGEITLVNNLALTGSGERRLGAADLTLNGGLTVDTVSLINESEINLSLKGNLTFNNGSFDIRNGLVTFDGSQQQNVGGLSAFSGSNALTSAIVKNGKGLSLSNDLEVTKTMTVNGGNIVSTNSSALIISNPSLTALQLNDPASFIGTTLRKRLTANDSYDFRVGKDDRPATLNLSSLDASGLWEVEYFNANPANANPAMNPASMEASDLKFVSHNEYWRVKAPATANAGVTVRWDEQSGFSTESTETQKMRMVEWTSANAWSIVDGVVYHNEGDFFGAIESNGAVGFNKISGKGNFFTIGSIEKYLYDWTGNLDSDWFNPGNWDDGKVPTSNTEVTIGVVSSLPEIGLNSEKDAYALDLTINPSASVTLRPGATLNVSGSFENNGDVVLKSNPNAVAALNVPVDNADSGHGIVELSGLKANQWYRFGQPISDATGGIYKASGDKSWVYRSTTNWERIQSDTEIIHPMEGIMVLYEKDETLTYGGQLNTGEINWEVPYGRGFYLFSNPYPGSMRWDISNPNTGITVSDNVSSTIYYRVYAGSVEDDYMITYNGFSGFSTLVDGESMPGGYTTSNIGNISPMQSVWVKVNDSDKASIKVDNRARVSDNSLPLKSAGNNSDRDVIRIVQSNDLISDVAVVYFDGYFLEGLDRSDSEKMMNASKHIPEIFTRVENKNLAINGLPLLEADQLSIPLSVRIREKGEVAISMVLDDFTENYEVWLEDLELEIQTNMRDMEQYTYEWNNSGYNHNRFVMHLIKKVEIPTNIAEPDAPKAGEILISGYDDFVLVKISPDLLANGNAELTLMDLSGRQLSSTQTAANETEIQLPEATGVYLLKVTAGTQQKTAKVMRK